MSYVFDHYSWFVRVYTNPTFADYFVEIRKQTRKSFLDDVNRLIDWKPIEKVLRKKYRKVASADGRPAYPPVPMFKLLLLQRWYGLSDPGLEDALYDRISFLKFSGFSLGSSLQRSADRSKPMGFW